MAIENGEFIYPKATGPKFEFSDDESEEGHDDEDDDDGVDSNDEKEGVDSGKSGKKEAAPKPKVCFLPFVPLLYSSLRSIRISMWKTNAF